MNEPKVIAEIGCNHKGDMKIALEMINVASTFCNADAVKFQKRNNTEYLSKKQYDSPHPNPENSYGQTYGKHREFLEFNLAQHRELKKYCDELSIEYGCSVWDVTSAKEIISLDPVTIKVPSACNTNFKLLNVLAREYSGEIHISLGMTNRKEEAEIVDFFDQQDRLSDVVLYSCTSDYPAQFEDVCLLEILRLKDLYEERVKSIGFSGHHLGISVDIAAQTLGADLIERHFTLDRTWKGTDHAASLEPGGLRKLVRDVKAVAKTLTYKSEEILPAEIAQRKKLKTHNRLEDE